MEEHRLHSDNDLELAKHLDNLNSGVDSTSSDPLLAHVEKYKESSGRDVEGKADVWNSLQAKLDSNSQKVDYAPLRLVTSRLLGIAATVLVAAVAAWFWLSPGSEIVEYVALAGEGNTTVLLEDGTNILLRQNSRLNRVDEHSFELDGEAFFVVAHNPDRVFRVYGNEGSIEVLGTEFNVDTRLGKLNTYLKNGSIRLTSSSNFIDLVPGNAAVIENGRASLENNPSEREYLDWQLGYLELSQTQVEAAIEELTQHFNIKINMPSNLIGETISGSLSLENLETSLNDLGLVLNGAFEKQDESTYNFITK